MYIFREEISLRNVEYEVHGAGKVMLCPCRLKGSTLVPQSVADSLFRRDRIYHKYSRGINLHYIAASVRIVYRKYIIPVSCMIVWRVNPIGSHMDIRRNVRPDRLYPDRIFLILRQCYDHILTEEVGLRNRKCGCQRLAVIQFASGYIIGRRILRRDDRRYGIHHQHMAAVRQRITYIPIPVRGGKGNHSPKLPGLLPGQRYGSGKFRPVHRILNRSCLHIRILLHILCTDALLALITPCKVIHSRRVVIGRKSNGNRRIVEPQGNG